ncbi:hypothetical protein Mpal_1465 [Methanosphaerula palustris E1-9c]|uniref:Uncharacterized protein n=1 Tax=Methanosphaerula palustris (strain ATCC BAA-1556 / DSM 19958 / E1-9c) TaxID=521011 RepID=B8GI48_METPE|nr:hypothetical protein Mpal_1465 [Methanosphaerula palustris E1-9c]
MSTNRHIELIGYICSEPRSSQVPLYSCKYSRGTYTQHQLMAILLFCEALGTDHRNVVELTNLMSRIKVILHTFTTMIHSVVMIIIVEAFQQNHNFQLFVLVCNHQENRKLL